MTENGDDRPRDRDGTRADRTDRCVDRAGDPPATRAKDVVPAPSPPSRQIDLDHVVVRYEDGPDRCTVFPPETTGWARLSTWLTVDRELLRSLDAWR